MRSWVFLLTWIVAWPMGTHTAYAQSIAASELQVPWELIRRQAEAALPKKGVFKTDLGTAEWSREPGQLNLSLGNGKLFLDELKIDIQEDTPEQKAQKLAKLKQLKTPTLPRIGPNDLELSAGESPDTLRVSYAPKVIRFRQDSPLRLTAQQLGIKHDFFDLEAKNISVDISGVQLKLKNGVEAILEARITTGKNGTPELKAARPEIRLNPEGLEIDCSLIQINLGEASTGQLRPSPELEMTIRDAACQYLKESGSTIWAENSSDLNQILRDQISASALKQVNETLQAQYSAYQKQAVELAIQGLAFAQKGVRIGIGPTGSPCGFDPQADTLPLQSDEAMVLAQEREIQHLIQTLFESPQSRRLEIPGWGVLNLDSAPDLSLLDAPESGEPGAIEIQVAGNFSQFPGQSLPGYAALAKPPIQAKGRLRLRPLVKDGIVSFELLRSLDLRVTDQSGQAVQIEQDENGGRVSIPERTLQNLADGMLMMHSDGKWVEKPELAILNTKTKGLTQLVVRSNKEVWTADGMAQVGRLEPSGEVIDTKGNRIPDLVMIERRKANLPEKRSLTVLGRPKLTLGPKGTLQVELQVDVDPNTTPELKSLSDAMVEEVCEARTTAEEVVLVPSGPSTIRRTVNCKPYVARGTRPLEHITTQVRAAAKIETKDGKLQVSLDGVKPLKLEDTNLAASSVSTLGWWGEVAADLGMGSLVGLSDKGTIKEQVLFSINQQIQSANQELGSKPLFEVPLSEIPGWSELQSKTGISDPSIDSSNGELALRYRFSEQRRTFLSSQSTDSGFAQQLLAGASTEEQKLAGDLLKMVHVRDAAIRRDPRTRKTRFEVKLAEGPAPWRTPLNTKSGALDLPKGSSGR
ncbi:MAG: hypothetical protein ACK5QT_00200 [Oligoflexia bacterium]